MTDKEREQQIAHYREKMFEAWNSGKRAEARLMCRVHAGLIRGRSPEIIKKIELERGLA